jgi:hypothetical protein
MTPATIVATAQRNPSEVGVELVVRFEENQA